MDKIIDIPTVKDYNDYWGLPTRHKYVNIFEGSQLPNPIRHCRKNVGMYVIFLKDVMCADYVTYGRQTYDFQENTLVFIGPGQVFGHPNDGSTYEAKGWALYFSPELFLGTSLGKHINDYRFFSYATNEALHISQHERDIIIDCFRRINEEINNNDDKHSNLIIASLIELLLNYCVRFYDRQFNTRKRVNNDVIIRFEELLNSYFSDNQATQHGIPSVAWFADKVNLSANYFGDIIKKQTGKSAQEYIQQKIIELAKNQLISTQKTIGEIAAYLGYQYPQYFTRAFKKNTGESPTNYRKEFLNLQHNKQQ